MDISEQFNHKKPSSKLNHMSVTTINHMSVTTINHMSVTTECKNTSTQLHGKVKEKWF